MILLFPHIGSLAGWPSRSFLWNMSGELSAYRFPSRMALPAAPLGCPSRPVCLSRPPPENARTPGEARRGQERPGEARSGQERSGKAAKSQKRPGEARRGQERPGEARRGQERPGETRRGQKRPGEARRHQSDTLTREHSNLAFGLSMTGS
jgi:hypothetical protein